MKLILLDTNIVIYLLNGKPEIRSLLEKFSNTLFSINIVTWIEILAGSFYHQQNMAEIESRLRNFIRLPLDEATARITARLIQIDKKGHRKISFQDTAIGATALMHNIPLITNNPRDFQRIKGLKIISPKK